MAKYKRILLKISGEALAGIRKDGNILDSEVLHTFARAIKKIKEYDVDIAIVVGGGNIWRGKIATEVGMERSSADYMGMLATVINSIALQNILELNGVDTRVQTALQINAVAEPYIRRKAIRHLEKGRVLIFGGGTGNPYFSTDTTAALRAAEIGADVILMAKNGVDGVYDCDPRTNKNASLIKSITFKDLFQMGLQVMDNTAISLCMDNNIDLIVFNMSDPENIVKVIRGDDIGTVISNESKGE